jgi:hypothetical protein
MNLNKRKAQIAGVLLISGMVAGMLSVAPAIDAPDFLMKASANANQVIIGAIFQFIMSVSYLGVAIVLYPILKKLNDTLALGFLGFRIVAAVFVIVGAVILILILTLSQEFVNASSQDLSYFHVLGNLLRTGRDMVNHVFMILALSIGGLMFYIILFQTRLVPAWLSVWGFSGTVLTMLASLLVLFRSIDIITPVYIILNLPMALLEVSIAIWLIVKGFDKTVLEKIADFPHRITTM